MNKRLCYNCQNEIPPETEHFSFEEEVYCTDCVEVRPYTAYLYSVDGEYMGNSEDSLVRHIEAHEDEWEG